MTEKPDAGGWKKVFRPSRARLPSVDKHWPRSAPPLTKVSPAQGKGLVVQAHTGNSSSGARGMLSAVHRISPPPPRGRTIPLAPALQPSKAPLPAGSSAPGASPSQESLSSRFSNDDRALVSAGPRRDPLAQSDPGLVPGRIPSGSDPRSSRSSRLHSRNPSVARSIRDLSPGPFFGRDPSEEKPATAGILQRLASPPRPTAQALASLPHPSHPSAIMPGASSPPSMPGGYASEPMSRNPSGQSHNSWHADLRNYPPIAPGAEGWASSLPENIDISQVLRGRTGPEPLGAWPRYEYEYEDGGKSIAFGGHEVNLRDARQRLQRDQERAQASLQHGFSSNSDLSSPKAWQEPLQRRDLNSRRRGDSSPASSNLNGLGLQVR
jgi:hypothetical protein